MSIFPDQIRPETYAAIRFGLGLPARGAPTDPAAMLDRLAGPDAIAQAIPHIPFEEVRLATVGYRTAHRAAKKGDEEAKEERRMWRAWLNSAGASAFVTDMARLVETADPFRERLAWFWSDHFTVRMPTIHLRSSASNHLEDAIRPNLNGSFAELLKAAVTHPVMLIYLDQTVSIGPNSAVGKRRKRGLNENLAREVLELHTLGVDGGFTQTDVTEFAELLTGLQFDMTKGFQFVAKRAEPGTETVLDKEYGGDPPALAHVHAALEDLARHPSTARHLAWKLAVHFVADDPDPDLVAHIAAAWRRTDGNLPDVYAAMLEHPAAWRGFGAKVKRPLEYMAGVLRAIGARERDLKLLKQGQVRKFLMVPLSNMGQPFMAASGPNGFPEAAEAWIQPQSLAARISFAAETIRRIDRRPTDPAAFLDEVLADAAGPKLRWAVGAAETRAEALGLILASAEFNRR